eukprot:4723158-Amphidinium_carterae.1
MEPAAYSCLATRLAEEHSSPRPPQMNSGQCEAVYRLPQHACPQATHPSSEHSHAHAPKSLAAQTRQTPAVALAGQDVQPIHSKP